ncbi:MAG: hypothetical protein Q9187_000893 [Circinaria calcarea]
MMLALSIKALALATLTASAAIQERTSNVQSPRAIYFLSTQQPSAEIYALKVLSSGRVTAGSKTPLGPGGPDVDPAAISLIAPQGAVRIVDNLLFAVNAASNTVSLFEIDRSDPTKLTRIGPPVTTPQYPVSVTASLKNKLVCVANAGTPTGLGCASFSPESGIGKMDNIRPYFTPDGAPSSGTFNLVGGTFFSSNGDAVFTTIMGNGTTFNGFLSAYPVIDGAVLYEQTTSFPAGLAFFYGATTVPNTSEIFAADIGTGALVIDVNSTLQGETKFIIDLPGQIASCWAEISTKTGTGYITDPFGNSTYAVDVQSGTFLSRLSTVGAVDFIPGGDFLYVTSLGNAANPFNTNNTTIVGPAVFVLDTRGRKGSLRHYQSFTPEGMKASAQGMAVFPASSS